MAVSNTSLRSPDTGGYACNGVTVNFAGTFRLLAAADVEVILADSDGNEDVLVLTTDYTISPTGGSYPADAFTVTTVETYGSEYTISMIRSMSLVQPTAYGNQGPYLPANHETSYDRNLLQTQQQQEVLDRCVKYPPSVDTSGVVIILDTDGSLILSYLQPGSVSTESLADNAVTYAKMQNISATDKLLGRSTAGAGDPEEISCTAAGRALLDDASATAQRTTLGLGTMATQAASAVAITGGTISGVTISGTNALATSELLYIEDQKASGTAGGGSTAAAWNVRTLNTKVVDNISGASILSNQITLPAGTYWVTFDGPACLDATVPGYHKIRLRNVDDSTTAAIGGQGFMDDASGGVSQTIATGSGLFTIAAEKTFELQHYTSFTQATFGLGKAATSGEVEVYGRISIWKVG